MNPNQDNRTTPPLLAAIPTRMLTDISQSQCARPDPNDYSKLRKYYERDIADCPQVEERLP